MSVLTALAPLAGLLGLVSALWIDLAVSRQQSGRASAWSLGLTLAAGLATALFAYLASSDLVLASAVLAASAALCVAVSTDLRFGLLADLTSGIIALSALAAAPVLSPDLTRLDMLIAAGLAMGILGLAGLYGRLRRGQMGLGGGDIVLAGALGLWCSPVTSALGVALGAGLTLLLALVTRARADARLAFGPGLAAGFLLALALDKLS